ncbi:FHA domain-containing protein [Myxococcota bacterium]|nr:FHA domain-containing protein [Myxococcota bacterium]
MLKLIIEDDENQVKVVRLLRDEITIGRKEGNTIRLTERNVSRKHARLIKKNDDIVLEDMGSYNGVKVNGVRISEPVDIDEGDKILIGDYTLMLKVEEKSEVDPFEEMATIPVERLDEASIGGGNAVSENSPTVQVAVKGLQQDVATAAAAPVSAPATPQQSPAPSATAAPAAASSGNAIPGDKRAKLVVTTSNYAGTTFEIVQSPMVIGRNRENDVFIDHASLSAIHAQISLEGDTYSIEDMGSKNGMLINNEEYSKMSLRKGDVIQLGHVRLRFVAPGEIYDFASEAQMEFGQPSNKKTIFIALGLVAAFGLVFILAMSGVFSSKKKGGSSSADAPDISKVLTSLDTQKSQKNWDEAIKTAKSSLEIKGLTPEQKSKLQIQLQAMRDEKNHKQLMAKVDPLLKKAKWVEAVTIALTIPKSSAYFNEAQAKVSTGKQSFLSNAISKSKVALAEKKCATINDFVDKAASFNFSPKELTELTGLQTKCRPTGTEVVTNGNMTAPPKPMSKGMHTTPPEDMTPPDMGTPDTPPVMHETMKTPEVMHEPMKDPPVMSGSSGTALLAEGKSAYQSGNCSKAVAILKKAYAKTGSGQALKYIGLCGCKSKRKSWAKWAYSKMGGGQKRLIQKLCKKKGINL